MPKIYIGDIAPYTVITPLIMGAMRYKEFTSALKTSYYYLIVATAANFFSVITSQLGYNNLAMLHFYTAVEFIMLCFYIKSLPLAPVTFKQAMFISIGFVLFCIVNVVFFESLTSFNAYPRSVEAIVILLLVLTYFNKEIKQLHVNNWTKNPYTWINFGLLIYFASSLALFVFSNILLVKTARPVLLLIWEFHAAVLLVMYQLFAIGYSKCKA
jgi:hypothetical protein